ncbi:MAG: protein kinase [Myxococcaceae bacterium]|nr:protein kinase [Myxococcaceae bacterium]
MTVPPGTLVAGRFSVQRMEGHGGMGLIYKARDTESGRTVALKLMHATADSESARRFAREAQVLSRLLHPGIVSYVAHGLTDDGQPFLAMEWLEGEDLERRLARQALAFSEVLLLLRRAAEVLAAAHAQGIIHRDIKPSNLFLCEGKVETLKLLDFGLARAKASSKPLTGSRVVLGTPGYMAPEQAASQPDITPSADVFSLGCVLYECLIGQAPFRASHVAAILAKILYVDPVPLRVLRPELPVALQGLMDRMLAKDPGQRLTDGQHLLRALAELGTSHGEIPPAPAALRVAPAPGGEPDSEQQLVSVLLATPEPPSKEGLARTMGAQDAAQARRRLKPLLEELRAHGAKASLLANNSLLATFLLERGTATDQAALAGHCALLIKERWPEGLVVLTTGLTLRGRPQPVGEVMDRAGELLRLMESRHEPTLSHVTLDETTAGLLEPRFQLDKAGPGAFLLLREHLDVDTSRPLLGRPTPCVGREQELAMLEMTFLSCVEDSAARAVLVTAPAGIGKSRLRHEFLRRLERRGPPPQVLLGRADPMTAGSAYGLLGQAVRRLCGVVHGEPLEARREKLARRTCRYLLPEQMKDTAEFLGELCGVPFGVEDSPKLRAAREDPRLMSQQVMRAMVSFLRAELAQGPVLLVLEDLHWGDAPTVRLVDEVLGALAECPLVVLALARPEVRELFPRLWPRWLQEVPLRGLSQKASSRLVQEVLGPGLSPAVMERLVEQAAGNALFLEELIRGVAEGHGEKTPGTVLAMLQSRLQRLDVGPRRVLLAGAIFGRTFSQGGVKALVDEELSAEELERCLRQVTELEVVELQADSRPPVKAEYRFRHALVRDAAYSLVPDRLKPVSHRRAGAWLEQAGEQDPLVLAEHYQLGQDQEKAAWFFTRAAERLVERQDLQGAQRSLKAALACAPQGELLVELRATEAVTSFWAEDFEHAYAVGERVRPELRPGSTAWARVMGGLMLVGAQSGRLADLMFLRQLFLAATPDPDAVPVYTQAASFLNSLHLWCGQPAEAAAVLERMDQVCSAAAAREGITRGWLYCAHGYFDHFHLARPWRGRSWAEQGTQAFLEVNSESNVTATQTLWGLTLMALGDVPTAVEVMHEGLTHALRAALMYPIHYTQMHLSLVLASSREPAHHEEARQLSLQALETERVNLLRLGIAHLALAKLAALQGHLSEAEAQARKACEVLAMFVPYRLLAHTTLSAVLLAQKRVAEARAEAEQGVKALEQMGGAGAMSVGTWLALAEACFAQADTAAGEQALRKAVHCARLRAEDIPEDVARERFLSQVPENARTRELARERWGTGWDSPPAG